MKAITKVNQIKEGRWYWRDGKTPIRATKRGRWMYFSGGNWIQPYPAGRILKSHDIRGPIPWP